MSSRKRARGVLVFAVLMSLWSSTATSQEVRTRRTRTIQIDGRPIVESLRPDDEVVELAPLGDWPGEVRVKPSDLFRELVDVGLSSVLVVHVTGVSGVLTGGGRFVETQFVGRIAEVIRRSPKNASARELERDKSVEFTVPGGEAAIKGVLVRSAEDLTHYPYPANYVVLINRKQDENGWAVGMSPPLLLKDDAASAVAPAKSLLTGLTLAEMRTISAAAK